MSSESMVVVLYMIGVIHIQAIRNTETMYWTSLKNTSIDERNSYSPVMKIRERIVIMGRNSSAHGLIG